MGLDKKQSREYVEAVPGPAIVISKETFEKMQENNNAKEKQEILAECSNFFQNIKNKTKLPEEEDELSL